MASFNETVGYRPRLPASKDKSMGLPQSAARGLPGQREALQMRGHFLRTGVVSNASGSAYVEQGQTKVLCSVHGPRTKQQGMSEYSDKGELTCDVRFAPFAQLDTSRLDNRQSTDEKHMSQVIRRALIASVQLHRFPKSVLDIHVLVLQDDGSALATAITSASLALADAGVDLFDIVAACMVAVVPSENKTKTGTESMTLVVDPTASEEKAAPATVLVARMPALDQVTELKVAGCVEFDTMGTTLSTALEGCVAVAKLMKEQLRKSMEEQEKEEANVESR